MIANHLFSSSKINICKIGLWPYTSSLRAYVTSNLIRCRGQEKRPQLVRILQRQESKVSGPTTLYTCKKMLYRNLGIIGLLFTVWAWSNLVLITKKEIRPTPRKEIDQNARIHKKEMNQNDNSSSGIRSHTDTTEAAEGKPVVGIVAKATMCGFFGFLGLYAPYYCVRYARSYVRYIKLIQQGQLVQIQTFGPFPFRVEPIIVPLRQVYVHPHRQDTTNVKSMALLIEKGDQHLIKYISVKRGNFLYPTLFDETVGSQVLSVESQDQANREQPGGRGNSG